MASTATTMRASVLTGPSTIALEERPVPEPGPDEVLVRVGSVGVCGSDVHYYRHGRIGSMVVEGPLVLGHEVGGTIVAAGGAVDRSRVGQRVALEPQLPCRRCRQCKTGHLNLCPDMQFFATPPIDGAFCDYVVLPADFAHPVPDSMSDAAVALCEPLSVGLWANQKAGTRAGSRVFVTGAGPIGVLAAMAAQAMGATEIVVSDLLESRRKRISGIVDVTAVDPREGFDPAELEADVFLECSGATPALRDGLKAVRSGGTAVLVGHGDEEVSLPVMDLQVREVCADRDLPLRRHLADRDLARVDRSRRPGRAGHRQLRARRRGGRAHQRRRPGEHEVRGGGGGVNGPFDLEGRTALVTGANRGLGRAFAAALADFGADVVIVGRSADLNREAAEQVAEQSGRRTTAVTGDVTDADDVRRIVEEAIAAHGRIDVLVNNAGICYHRPALEVPDEEFLDVFDVNVTGLWRMSRAVAPHMITAGGGSIVNVGSISALIVNRPQWQPAYNASKAAVHQLTKSLAAEWAPHGIRVNAIAPGYVKTEMAPVDEPRFRRHWIEDAPMQRYATPEEIAPSVVYLASDAASFTTGTVLVTDGGYTLF